MGSSEARALLDVLLEHVCRHTTADGARFCEWDPAADAYTVLAVRGAAPAGGTEPRRALMAADAPTAARADDEAADAGVRDLLRASGMATLLTVPVLDRPGGVWFLDLVYADPARRPGTDELDTAADLAPLAAAALVRDEWVRELAAAAAEQAAALDALVASESRFRVLLENVRLAAVIVDGEGRITFCNDYLLEITGWDREDLIGRVYTAALMPPEESGAGAEQRVSALRGELVMVESHVLTRTGERRLISWTTTRLYDQAGAVSGLASIGADITEQRRVEEELRESEQRRQHLVESLLHREEEERARIATELHDDTIQVITAALLSIDRLSRAARDGNPDRLEVALTSVRSSLQAAVDRTRRLTFELRPPLLERHGITPALRDLAEEASKEAGFEVRLTAEVGRYPFTVEDLTYRTVQEAMANVRKHSAAQHVEIRVVDTGAAITGHVRDDGRGFDVTQALDRSRMRLHLGLDAMVERVKLAGGDVVITSQPGEGATVTFTIPIGPASALAEAPAPPEAVAGPAGGLG